ncbi:unnamed protein product [Periconia digitata]|uniref:Uncharacterized protein n=1 Tax=Periconia digitata TaxID=1303443 RepID=A0A9W4XGX2_9PLEO|nr:unnamed protein product [Periconia digitata]
MSHKHCSWNHLSFYTFLRVILPYCPSLSRPLYLQRIIHAK